MNPNVIAFYQRLIRYRQSGSQIRIPLWLVRLCSIVIRVSYLPRIPHKNEERSAPHARVGLLPCTKYGVLLCLTLLRETKPSIASHFLSFSCSHAPRIDQIPTYSGCHGTDEAHVDDDNPYKPYKPLNKVRREIPSHAFPYMTHHMPGYTGCLSKLSRTTKRASESGDMEADSNSVKIAN
ncbi:unnamed protein product [Dicrocoelium dendriticum]|nr:unnamed protein product [Dicrocoelium dendriticum]